MDTLSIRCKTLGRTHPVFVYRPHGFARTRSQFPVIFVTDGGEYLSLGLMHNVLDNLIAEKRIRPIVAVFIDPRTDIGNSGTSRRMTDYAMSDTFVTFLINDVRSRLLKEYRLTSDPGETAIMGASLGGLIATYAAYSRPEVFGLCAAQSPSYWFNGGAVIRLIRDGREGRSGSTLIPERCVTVRQKQRRCAMSCSRRATLSAMPSTPKATTGPTGAPASPTS